MCIVDLECGDETIADLKFNFEEILLGISTNSMEHLFTPYFTLDLVDISNKINS
jgi:hypothetical protein